MKLLVTGGCGFIGSNFIRHILKKYPSYKVVNWDKLTYAGNPDNLRDVQANKNYTFVKGDISDRRLAERLLPQCDCIVNFAAATHVDRSIQDAGDFIKSNIQGAYTLLEAARGSKIKRFLQISTDEVYGSVEKGRSKENDSLFPNSPYSASKAAADHLVRAYGVTYKLPVIITRSSNNFGPYQYPEKVIPLFITNLLEGKKAPLYGDGLNKRDWLFVQDNCRAIDTVLHKGKTGEIYNIGAGREIPNIILTKDILKLTGMPQSSIQYVADRPGHDRRYALNVNKLKSLGWSQEYRFTDALRLTIEWYKNNHNWWKKLKKPSS
ncbi:MAG TPA: dTDP-glucose 4,6-dehydratase [Candidatus Omnitrophota bacterium]|nr:dTDP-glucose 4,6-dehydratase [Candidatus Omnitrophota bacterium]